MQNTFASQDNPAAQAAKRYAQFGLIPVPLRHNQKTAYHRGWPRLQPRTLLRQFEHHTGNIGMKMGRQSNGTTLVAVDVDTKNGGTLAALTQSRCWPTATASAITPSGGTHYLLRLPEIQMVRTRIGLIKGVDLIGEGGLIVVEPSAIDDKEYVWIRHPAKGIAPAPPWLLTDLRRAGLVVESGPRRLRSGQSARNTSQVPRAARQPLSGPWRPIRKAAAAEPGLLAETLARFPVAGPGTRHNQLIRLICALVCDPRQIPDPIIQQVVLDWWQHWFTLGLCRTPPDTRTVQVEIRRTRRSHSLGRIATGSASRYARLCSLLRRPLPFLPYGGLGGREAPGTRPLQLGPTEACFVATLLVHFAGEALLAHPLDESYKATNQQLITKMKWIHGKAIKGRELRDLKRKFITRSWSSERASKLELLVCTREGYRTGEELVPSTYRFTESFLGLLDCSYALVI